jgi:hypothetical protein
MTDALDKQIVIYLLSSSKKTTSQIAKALKESPTKIEYHVQKLLTENVLCVDVLVKAAVRQYGKKYYINPQLRSDGKASFLLSVLTMTLTIIGLLSFPLNPLYSATTLIIPSVVATVWAMRSLVLLRQREIDAVLKYV